MLFPTVMFPYALKSRQLKTPLRFGWTEQNPPQKQSLSLQREDYDAHYQPTPHFIRQISDRLMRQEQLQLPGFVMVDKLESQIPAAKLNPFLEKTMLALKKYLSHWHLKAFNPNEHPLIVIQKRQVDGQIPETGNLHTTETQGKWTLKSPHFDRNALLVLHRYEPTQNVRDGNLQVIDLKQFLRDHPTESLSKLLNADKTIRPDYWPRLKPYTLTLPTNNQDHRVVFMNNTIQNGIAHGVTPLQVMDPNKPIHRVFERYTITPETANQALPPDTRAILEAE